jgi:hypothetical protein
MPRWVLVIVIILMLFALDRAYMRGENAALLRLGAHRAADVFTGWARDLTRKAQ